MDIVAMAVISKRQYAFNDCFIQFVKSVQEIQDFPLAGGNVSPIKLTDRPFKSCTQSLFAYSRFLVSSHSIHKQM